MRCCDLFTLTANSFGSEQALAPHKRIGAKACVQCDQPHFVVFFLCTIWEAHKSTALSAVELREKLRAERTNLMPKILESWDEVPLPLQLMDGSSPLYGYIGMDDNTLHPFIRPGAFVRIDPRQKKIPVVDWHSDHDRPIFFVELRERYVCSWCEMP
jgi:hypothetical protein